MTDTTDTQHGTERGPSTDGPMARPLQDRVLAGVALAVANKLGLPPVAVRIVWFVLLFFGGLGILLYIAGWLLIPEEGAAQSIAERAMGRLSDSTAWIGVALIVIATVMLVTLGGWVRADLAWAVALLVVGILLYRGRLDTMFEPRPTRPDPSESTDVPAVDEVVEETEVTGDGGSVDGEEPTRVEEVADRVPAPSVDGMSARREGDGPAKEKSILGRLTIGAAFIALGVMAALDSADVAQPAFSHYLALFVGIIGVGLLVGSVMGRSRGLIFLGLTLVPIMLASSVVTADFDGGWGDPVFRPRNTNEVQSKYGLTGGDLEIDLRSVTLDQGDELRVEGDVGFGRLLVIVPEGLGLDIRAHVGFGDLQVDTSGFNSRNGGIDVDRVVFVEGDGLLVLDLDVGFGELEIREASR